VANFTETPPVVNKTLHNAKKVLTDGQRAESRITQCLRHLMSKWIEQVQPKTQPLIYFCWEPCSGWQVECL